MVDKGFDIQNLLLEKSAKLIIPPFKKQAQFTKRKGQSTSHIAKVRIHVECCISRIKDHRIFKTVLPWILKDHTSDMFKICVALTALLPAVLSG